MDTRKSLSEISAAISDTLEDLRDVLVRDDMNDNHFRIRPMKSPWDIIPRIVDVFPDRD